ncbi:MAG: winged helix-turn-helix transcriptional regulator [Bacteroidales bacterium]|nr:winged helix-turn-helix transcriptional regulator [Bacteroidales bacterium]
MTEEYNIKTLTTTQEGQTLDRKSACFNPKGSGILPSMVRIGNLRTTHFSRNPKIAQMLHEYEYVREFGEGIDRIYREMAEVGQPAPEFKQYDFMLRATIKKAVAQDVLQGNPQDNAQETTQKTTQKTPQKTSQKTPQKILELIEGNPQITTQEMADFIGIDIRNIHRNIKKLQEQGVIRRVGPDKGGHWEVITLEKKK